MEGITRSQIQSILAVAVAVAASVGGTLGAVNPKLATIVALVAALSAAVGRTLSAATDNHAVGEMSRKPTPFGCSDGDGAPNPPATVRRTSTACGHPRNRTNKDLTSGRLRGATPTTAGRRRDVGWAESRGIRVAGTGGSVRPDHHKKAPR